MGEYGMTEYYKEKLEAGLQYQDYIADKLRKEDPCMIFIPYTSRKSQVEKGESASGIEVKHDMRFSETGNLYIEVAEKSKPEMPSYTKSGIFRDDNTFLYLIGNYEQAFLFSKDQLKNVYRDKTKYEARGIVERKTPTSIGFTIPINKALNGICIKHYKFKE